MANCNKCFYILVMIGIVAAFASCKNASTNEAPPQAGFAKPVSQPLKLSAAKKIDWDTIKSTVVHPLVKKFDLSKLPTQAYDTSGFKPFKYPVQETKFNYDSLPQKDFDIDKLPSHPLKFTTTILPAPTPIKVKPPQLKDTVLSLYEFGEAQGLFGRFMLHVFTDNDGFLWFCTDKGFYRYDGENLLFMTDHRSFASVMYQDSQGLIWMNNANGLEVLDVQNGILKKVLVPGGIEPNGITGIVEDEQQRIWVAGGLPGVINIIDIKTQTYKSLDKAHGFPDTLATGIIQDKKQNIWFTTEAGINIIDLKNKKTRRLGGPNGFELDSAYNMFYDRADRIWMGLNNGMINVLDTKKNTIQLFKVGPQSTNSFGYISGFKQDDNNRIWVATWTNGLEVIDPEKRLVRYINHSNGLSYKYTSLISKDKQGQVWVNMGNGLGIIGNSKAVNDHIGMTGSTSLAEDRQGLLWRATNTTGIDILNRENKTSSHFGSGQGLVNDTMIFVKQINGKMFISTFNGLDIVDQQLNTIAHLGGNKGLDKIYSVAIDKAGKIWTGNLDRELNVYDPKNNTITHLGKAQGLSDGGAKDMATDDAGRLWITREGAGVIDIIDPATSTIQYLKIPGLKSVAQSEFQFDSKGNIWIATGNGIYIADLKDKTLTSFSTPQGLIDESVSSLLQYHNQFYASTDKGLTIITPPAEGIDVNKNWKAESFGKAYGLIKKNGGYQTDMITHDGLYAWGDLGITLLDPSKKDNYVAPTYIQGITLKDQLKYFSGKRRSAADNITWDKVTGPNNMPVNLQLPYNQNYPQFMYRALSFTDHDTTWYRYRLRGYDTTWSENTTLTSKSYFSLSPGKYTFEVISKSTDSGWGKPAIFSFTINPPWWQTWWAYLLYAALLAGTIWGFSHYRSRQLIKDKRILEHKVQLRTEEVVQQKEEIESQRDNLEVQRNDLEKAFGKLKTAQTQLIQSEKMASLGELTAGIAHEIQNPLNFVNNFSEVNQEMLEELKAESIKPKAERNDQAELDLINDLIENEKKVNHHGKRADSIVKGMLEHSRANTGEKQLTDMNVLCDEFLKLSYHGLRAKDKSFNAEMITHFDPNLPKVNVSQQDMGRVMLNLFNNAFYAVNQKSKMAGVDYQPAVTATTFTAAPDAGSWGIKVKDNGVGIPDTIKDKIMQPFFTTKPTGEGTGLGLSLTYDIVVKGHGGSISVNTKEGEYTEFIVSLPLN